MRVRPGRAPAGAQDRSNMSSTHLSLHYHVIFATKERRAIIAPSWRERLHAFIGGVLREMEAIPQSIGASRITCIYSWDLRQRIHFLPSCATSNAHRPNGSMGPSAIRHLHGRKVMEPSRL